MTPRPDLNNLAKEVHEANKLKGFHEVEHSNEHLLCLVTSELMEAVEADRKGKRANTKGCEDIIQKQRNPKQGISDSWYQTRYITTFLDYVKDSVEDELADAVIRLLDLAGLRGWKIDAMKDQWGLFYCKPLCEEFESFTEHIFAITGLIHEKSDIDFRENEIAELVILSIETLCQRLNIDLWLHVELKLKYNQTRPPKHGKAY